MNFMKLMRISAPPAHGARLAARGRPGPPGLPLAKRPSPVQGFEKEFEGSGVLLTSRSCGNGCVAITISASARSPNYGRYIEDIVGQLEMDGPWGGTTLASQRPPPDKIPG
jgi:hypothetical protein